MAEGSIVLKGNGRHYVITREKRPDGTWRQRSHGGYAKEKDAKRALREVLTAREKGTFVVPSKVTVAQFLENQWLPQARRQVRATTYETYERNVRNHVIPRLGTLRLQELSPGQVADFYTALEADGTRRYGGALAPKTIRNIHVLLRRALGYAVEMGVLVANPVERVKPPKANTAGARGVDDAMTSGELQTWTAAQLRTYLDHVADDRLYAAWMVSAATGMRRGEVLGLRWADLDLDTASAAVRQTIVVVNYEIRYSEPKTRRGRRTVDLDRQTVEALRSHRVRQAQERLAAGSAWHKADLVFTDPTGRPVHPHSFSQAFERHSKAAGLPAIRLHDLRHTHATLALKAGVPVKVVSERLGHASTAFTMDTYTHCIPGMQADAARQVAALIWADA